MTDDNKYFNVLASETICNIFGGNLFGEIG